MKKVSHTCIAIIKNRKGKLVMAGDRRARWDWGFSQAMPRPKIIKKNNILMGGTGDCFLLSLILDNFEPVLEGDVITYLNNGFKKGLIKLLKQHGYKDEHDLLRLQKDQEIELLVGIGGRAFIVGFFSGYNPEVLVEPSVIGVDEVALPFANGCGGNTAVPILVAEKKREGYSKKEHLTLAMEIAADISPGCDNNIDYISED